MLVSSPRAVGWLTKQSPSYVTHVQVSDPAQWVADYSAAGADGYTFHLEVGDHI